MSSAGGSELQQRHSRRLNFGNRYSEAIRQFKNDQLQADEALVEHYGTFEETEGDVDFNTDEASGDDQDSSDSDFSDEVSDNDEENDDDEKAKSDSDDSRRRRKPTAVVAKLMKRTTTKQPSGGAGPHKTRSQKAGSHKADPAEQEQPRTVPKRRKILRNVVVPGQPGSSYGFRSSTQRKSKITAEALSAKSQKTPATTQRKGPQLRRLTQEELLAEAELTEKANLESLALYHRLEVEKAKQRRVKLKRRIFTTGVRLNSVTMPVEEIGDYSLDYGRPISQAKQRSDMMVSRNFVTFYDMDLFRSIFKTQSSTSR